VWRHRLASSAGKLPTSDDLNEARAGIGCYLEFLQRRASAPGARLADARCRRVDDPTTAHVDVRLDSPERRSASDAALK
jgi:hypothetical protein